MFRSPKLYQISVLLVFLISCNTNTTPNEDHYKELNNSQKNCLNIKADFGQKKSIVLQNWKDLKKDFESSDDEYEVYYYVEIIVENNLSRVDYVFFKNNIFSKQVSIYTFDKNSTKDVNSLFLEENSCILEMQKLNLISIKYDTSSVLITISIEIDC